MVVKKILVKIDFYSINVIEGIHSANLPLDLD